MQNTLHRTRLPAGFRDHGPETTARLQRYWRRLDALFARKGYRRVITASVENFEVLRPGLGERSLGNTFRLIDPVTGETLAFRPDFTPQVARLFASGVLGRELPVRVSYRGAVLRREGAGGLSGAREIHQVGAELIGTKTGAKAGEADAEIVALAWETLKAARPDAVIDIGHAGIVAKLVDAARIPERERDEVIGWIVRKEAFEIERWAKGSAPRLRLAALTRAWGTFAEACRAAKGWGGIVGRELTGLAALDRALEKRRVRRSYDLGLADGFEYYTGILFRGYLPGAAQAVLKGGRYDRLCGNYGREAPAVGFALDSEAAALGAVPEGPAAKAPAKKGKR